MGIFVDIVEASKEKSKYPRLMKSTGSGTIVLFVAPGTGMSLTGYSGVGSYETTWNESTFEPFNGTIELSNRG